MRWPRTVSTNTILLVAALLLGGAAYWGTTRHVNQAVAANARAFEARFALQPTVVAAVDLMPGALLTFDSVAVRAIPAEFRSDDAVEPDAADQLIGRRLTHAARAGDPILKSALASAERTAFSEHVAAGARAVTVPVDETNAFSGLLQPGDRVDLMYAFERERAGEIRQAVRLLFADVPVLATGRATRTLRELQADGSARETDTQFSTATLSVTPEQAQVIALAQRSGDLVATLRHPQDRAALTLATRDSRALDDVPVARLGASRKASRSWLEIIHGGRGGAPQVLRVSRGGGMSLGDVP
jgi:pilus assembly protein CpaB